MEIWSIWMACREITRIYLFVKSNIAALIQPVLLMDLRSWITLLPPYVDVRGVAVYCFSP